MRAVNKIATAWRKLATFWLQMCHLTPKATDNYRNHRTDINDMISHTDWSFFFVRNSFSSQSLKRIGEDSILQSACEDNRAAYKCDIVRGLHYCITVTDHTSLYNNNNKSHVENWSLRSYYYLCVYVDYVCVCVFYKYHSNLKSLTPLKYFAIVVLQTIFWRQFVGIIIIYCNWVFTRWQ
jgi:hypothetical protein